MTDATRRAAVLLLACSGTKFDVTGPVRAIDLYDGPTFRVLRRSRRPDVVLILSALHGLIDANTLIEPYDLRMNAAIAHRFATDKQCLMDAAATIAQATDGREIARCHCVGGKLYASVIGEYSRLGMLPPNVTHDARGIGHKLGSLKTWLEGNTWKAENPGTIAPLTNVNTAAFVAKRRPEYRASC
jgi:hypothetical protein